jgi:polysaccharide chain length determinant protein (PEP-CTERM system associated)
MHDIINMVLAYLRGVWRQRWVIVVVAWGVCIVGWSMALRLPDEYRADARVLVDTDSMLRPLLSGLTVNTNVNRQIRLMVRTMLSRPNLEKIARMTDLDLNAQTPEDMEEILDDLSGQIKFKGGGRGFYRIAYTSEDPQLAKRVVQSLLTLFVETTLGASRLDTDSAQRFLDEQIKDYAAKVDAADERLRDFKRKNMGMMPGSEGGYYERMQSMLGQLKGVTLEMREAENRRQQLKEALAREKPLLDADNLVGATLETPYDQRIAALEVTLDELLLRFTEHHPEVILARRSLQELRERREQFKGELTEVGDDGEVAPTNPVYQQVKIALAETEANLASLRARKESYETQIQELQERVDAVLQVEIEYKRLNREYKINKGRLNTLLERRDKARLSQVVEERADDVKFKVIDPPRVPTNPVGPNRPALLTSSMVLGLAAGAGLAFLMSVLRAIYDNRRTLSDSTGLPVLGSVSMVWTPAQLLKRRLERLAFFLVSIALLGAYGVVMALQLFEGKLF